MFIEKITSPDDLKKLTITDCTVLASEIRCSLLKKISEKGGHLGSNLGVVELTIALHYVFNSPQDKIIFDVSHQCYTHKIITGRSRSFLEADCYDFVCGYTNPEESDHDLFRIGHASTSISLASGLAKARDILGQEGYVISVIGDGALGGGEAFEGLNFSASEIHNKFIIVLNDNQKSIADNHGGLYGALKELRDSLGESKNNIFKSIGYNYYFVQDGHNFSELLNTFNEAKLARGPVFIHLCTVKGKGYLFSENNKEATHWVRPFDIENGAEIMPFYGERYDRIIRDFLLKKMKIDKKVVTVIAAVPDALSFSSDFRKQADNQFVDVGICEEHAISMLAGLSKNGCKPVFATMSTFYQRSYDQISQELCLNKLRATLIVVNASVYAVNDSTHIGIFDIPLLSNIPNFVYLAPTNKQEYLSMLDWSIEQNQYPVAIRAPRNGVYEADCEVDTEYSQLNRYKVTRKGSTVAVIALGDFYQLGKTVVDKFFALKGIQLTLINPRYITGLDCELLNELKLNHSVVISLEDGIVNGGFGQKIAAFYGNSDVKCLVYGLKNQFLDRYNVSEVLQSNRLTAELIIEDLIGILK